MRASGDAFANAERNSVPLDYLLNKLRRRDRRPPLLNPVVGCRTARPCSERCYRHSGSRRIRLEIVELGGHRVGHIKRKLSGHVSGRNSIWWSAPHRSRSKSTERRACGTGATL